MIYSLKSLFLAFMISLSAMAGEVQRKIILAFAAVLLLMIALVYKGFRRNKISNFKLQHQQTEISLKNNILEALNRRQQLLLNEKEWLLREIHHRVRNNLQTTMSLLNMQTAYLSNSEAIAALQNSQQRMYAMSLVYQKLYQSDNFSTIHMKDYIQELASYLMEGFIVAGEIEFQLALEEIELDLARAIPVGLIINEAVSNSIKYAFPDERKGCISIRFLMTGANELMLSVSDNGIGLPETLDYELSHSLGLNLIIGLTSQLQGDIEIKKPPGMCLTIRFKTAEQNDNQINGDISI